MELNETQIAKADPLLKEALSTAQGDEFIRAILVLETGQLEVDQTISPKNFPSRQAYREELIKRRQQQLARAIGKTLEQLQSLSIKIIGDGISPALVVEGSVSQILAALEVPGVSEAALDRLIGLPHIARAQQIDAIGDLYLNIFTKYCKQLKTKQALKTKELYELENLAQKLDRQKSELITQIKLKEEDPNIARAQLHSLESQLHQTELNLTVIENKVYQVNKKINQIARNIELSNQDINDIYRKRDLIFQSVEQYILGYHQRYGKLQKLVREYSLDIENVSTRVQLLSSASDRQLDFASDPLSLSETINSSYKFHIESKLDGLTIAQQEPHLMVLGASGSGKSTFLQKLGWEALKGQGGQLKYECLPIFIELKEFTDTNISIQQVISRELQQYYFPYPEKFTLKALSMGKLLVLLDGLNEIPTAGKSSVISQIQDFVSQYPLNHFIISCRTTDYNQEFKNFHHIKISDLSDEEIQDYINNWFNSETYRQEKTAEKCWNLLNHPSHVTAKALARTLLLLNWICLVYSETENLVRNRASLYKSALNILMQKCWSEKDISSNADGCDVGVDVETEMLAKISYFSLKTGRLFFTREQLINQIQDFLADRENASKNLDAESILEAIVTIQDVLLERPRHIYSFSHFSIQEYFTAQYLFDHNQLVDEHLSDRRFREVFLFLAEISSAEPTGVNLV